MDQLTKDDMSLLERLKRLPEWLPEDLEKLAERTGHFGEWADAKEDEIFRWIHELESRI